MISYDFKVNKEKFEGRQSSILQHKLRPALKCYTIRNFILDETARTFTFNKTYMIKGHRIDDEKTDSGSFEVFEMEGTDQVHVRLNIS